MLIVALFTALSAVVTVAAPLPANLGTNAVEFNSRALYRRAVSEYCWILLYTDVT
jgi:hypothetical protein